MSDDMPVYTLQQVSEHRSEDDLWIVIQGKVYDVSSYLDDHPGGKDVLLQVSGGDATEDFDFVGHSEDARVTLSGFEIGLLAGYVHKPTDKKANGRASAKRNAGKLSNHASWTRLSQFASAVVAVLAGAGLFAVTFKSDFGGFISSRIPFHIIDGFFSGVLAALLVGICAGGLVLRRVRRELFHHKDVFQYVPYFDCKEELL